MRATLWDMAGARSQLLLLLSFMIRPGFGFPWLLLSQ